MHPNDEKPTTTSNKRFGRYFGTEKTNGARATDYSRDPKFNKAAALREEFDFYAQMNKKKGLDGVLDHGEQARKVRGHGNSSV